MHRGLSWTALCAVLLVPTAAAAADDATLDTVKLGDYLYGPDLKTEDLKGRVVLFESWGVK